MGLFAGVQLLRLIFSYLQTVLLNTVGQYVMFDIRRELYDKLQHQEVAYYDRNPVGRIMTRLTNDVDALNELFTQGVTDVLGDLVMIFAIIGVMLWMDVRLTLVTLLTVPLLFAATTWFRKGARRGYDMVRTRIARINAWEHFAGAQTVQIFNAESKSLGKFDEINDDYRRANLDTIFYYAVFFPLVDFIGAVGIALVIWYGGYRVMNSALTLGALVAFIPVLRILVSADSGYLRQVQCAAGRGGCFAPDLQNARLADCHHHSGQAFARGTGARLD